MSANESYTSCGRTRSVQKLLKNITTQEQISLFMTALSCGAADLSMNINGQHIMEYCLKNFSDEHKSVNLVSICYYLFILFIMRSHMLYFELMLVIFITMSYNRPACLQMTVFLIQIKHFYLIVKFSLIFFVHMLHILTL